MSDYRPRHARQPSPADLAELAKVSSGLLGVANLIQIVPSKSSSEEK